MSKRRNKFSVYIVHIGLKSPNSIEREEVGLHEYSRRDREEKSIRCRLDHDRPLLLAAIN